MKTLLTTLNSKYIHSNIAIRYLKGYCGNSDIEVCEYTINDNLSSITSDIYHKNPKIVAFSCYIWNIEQTLKVAHSLKKANNNIKVILGGPEVSFDIRETLINNSQIDFIVFGEGEATFKKLMDAFGSDNDFSKINGIAYRNSDEIIINEPTQLIADLDDIPFPYYDLEEFKDSMVYYESSRGCPYNCQYCLSSTIEGVRFLSMDRVKSDLDRFIEAGVSQVKFIDRSFNCNKKRTKEIFKFLIDLNPDLNFHFEINADIIDDEILEILKSAPKGLFQFEIGVQTTNPRTMDSIKRETNFEKLSNVVNTINSYNNIHLHLDLIAGLPYEGYMQFKKSFNDVYNLGPQMLQLGFLKLLRGSGLRSIAEKYNIKYNSYAPYEVISTDSITYDEILILKDIEDIVDKYYNSNRFVNTLRYITENIKSNPFDFYKHFSEYWKTKNLFKISHGLKNLYTILIDYISLYYNEHFEIINELLKYDYLLNNSSYVLPERITRGNIEIRGKVFEFLKNQNNINRFLPQFSELSAKQIIKKIHIEVFEYNILTKNINKEQVVLLFNYDIKDKISMNAYTADISKYFV